MLRTLVASVVLAFFLSVSQAQLAYPDTRTVEFTETHHGITVADPYRWLEGDVRESSEVADWVAAQNEVTFAYLNAIEGKDRLRRELGDRIAYDRIGIPFRVGERYTVSHSDGVRDHRIVHIIDDLSELSDIDNARVLLNPNEWSDDGSTSLAGTSFTRDGKLLAYSVSESGSDWRTWKFMDVETGEHLEDELRWVRYSGVSWDLHSEGVYYAAYPEPEDSTYTTQALGRKIMYHRLGTPQSDDVVVYDLGGGTTESPYVWTSENGRWLFFGRSVTGVTANEIRVHDLAKGFGTIDDALDLFVGLDGVYSTIGVDDTTLYVYTEFEAPNGRVISIDMANPEGGWDEVVPEQETSLRSAELVGSTLVLRRLVDAHTKVFIHRLDGALVRELSLPGIGTASGFDGRSRDTGTFFAFTSFDRPTEVWHYDLLTDRSELLWSPDAGFDPSEYTVKQVFFHSADGTRVPMFVTHRRDIELNGTNPTVLYGYGGFNIPQT
ncbi:MAG: S9 family peptidase, partial [Planctomycetota bacterium]